MSTLFRFGGLQATPETRAKLEHLLSNPKTRAAVARKLNRESEYIAQMCTQTAETELHRRSDDRRTDLSKSHGTHYVDSFVAVPAKEVGVDKLRVAVRNTHPAHRFVEKGTQPHRIEASQANVLHFPYAGSPGGHGGPRTFAPWAVEWSDTDGAFFGQGVDHPGAVRHEIMRRTLREYRRRAQRRLA